MAHIFCDIETLGLNVRKHQVWEIAWAINDGPIVSGFVLHDPPVLDNDTRAAVAVNGYAQRFDPKRVRGLGWEGGFEEALRGNTLVAANPHFDASFLEERWELWGVAAPWKYRLLDVEAYAMPAFGLSEPKGLAYIAEQLGVEPGDHTAAGDVRCLRECFRRLQNYYADALLYHPVRVA